MGMTKNNRILVGISGASGAPLALHLLRTMKKIGVESHLIVTDSGWRTIEYETGLKPDQVRNLADRVYPEEDISGPPASGSWDSLGMVVVPCSMKTLAGIHSGYSDNLLLRAADVTMKEQRRLVLVPRECPMSPVHLRNQYELSMMGVVILPPVLTYYHMPMDLEEMENQLIGKILAQFGLHSPDFYHWSGQNAEH